MGVCAAVFNPQRHTSASLTPALADARLSLGKQVANAFVVAHEDHHGHGDSGEGVRYRFCPRRGSPATRNTDIRPDLMMIHGRTLDDPDLVKPPVETYCDEKQRWLGLGGDLKSFGKMPG